MSNDILQQSKYHDDLNELKRSLADEQDRCSRLEGEKGELKERRVDLEQQLESLHASRDAERQTFKEREDELMNKINDITNVQIAVLEKEAVSCVTIYFPLPYCPTFSKPYIWSSG